MLLASRAASRAGEAGRAVELVDAALPLATDPLLRADLRHQQASIAASQGLAFSEDAVLQESRSVAALDPERAARLLGLLLERRLSALDTAAAVDLAEQRVALCAAAGPEWRLRTVGDLLTARTLRGETQAALDLLPELLTDVDRAADQALALIWMERYDDVRRTLFVALERARARGRPLEIARTEAFAAMLELRTGRVAVALAAAAESAALAEEVGAEDLLALNQPTLAQIAAIQGRDEDCHRHAGLAERLGAKRKDERVRAGGRLALGLLALGSGRPEETITQLEPVAALQTSHGVGEPSVLPFAPDLIEAYVRVGKTDPARAELDSFAGRARMTGRGWALAAAARCAGLLAAAESIDRCFEEALAIGDRSASPFEQARTRLCFGESLRRAGRRKEARDHLRAALDHFDASDAVPWAERAGAELRASGQHVARRDPAAPERLTPQELQIALLVAEGQSNRDVAGAMFLSRKTIEYHLSHVYRKLDVHSRSELTRLFAANAVPSPD